MGWADKDPSFCTIPSDRAPYVPYMYFGIEDGRDCRCGTTLLHPMVNRTSCDVTCKSDRAQLCGGQNVMNIWLNADYPDSNVSPKDHHLPIFTIF
jgi:hypothetical protein